MSTVFKVLGGLPCNCGGQFREVKIKIYDSEFDAVNCTRCRVWLTTAAVQAAMEEASREKSLCDSGERTGPDGS